MVFNSVYLYFLFSPHFPTDLLPGTHQVPQPGSSGRKLVLLCLGRSNLSDPYDIFQLFQLLYGKRTGDTQRKGFIPEEKSDFCHCDQPSDPGIFQILGISS